MIAAIEDAMIARLEAASESGTLGYTLKTVASYGGQLDEDGLKEVVKNYPAIWVVYGGAVRPDHVGQNTWLYRPVYHVIVAARSLRNEAATRKGSGDRVGSYQMIADVRALFAGHQLGLEIQTIELGSTTPLFNIAGRQRKLSVMAQSLHTAYHAGAPAAGDDLADFTKINLQWDLPGGADTKPPLPSAEADAHDIINLPGASGV